MKRLLFGGTIITLAAAAFAFTTLRATCVVGFTNADATITVRGFRSAGRCESIVQRGSGTMYARTEAPAGKVLCEMDHDGFHVTVRDAGGLMLLGRGTCAAMASARFWRDIEAGALQPQ